MTAFASAVAALFRDRNLARDATLRPEGQWDGVPVRVILRAPDAEVGWGETRARVPTMTVQVRAAEVPQLRKGDRFVIGDVFWRVTGEPQRDPHRLVWSAECAEDRP